MPFPVMVAMSKLWNTRFWSFYDNNTLCGFVYLEGDEKRNKVPAANMFQKIKINIPNCITLLRMMGTVWLLFLQPLSAACAVYLGGLDNAGKINAGKMVIGVELENDVTQHVSYLKSGDLLVLCPVFSGVFQICFV